MHAANHTSNAHTPLACCLYVAARATTTADLSPPGLLVVLWTLVLSVMPGTPDTLCALLRSWSELDLKRFLRFVTAMTCLPQADGKVKISKDHSGPQAFPKSHTCFNRLDMPDGMSRETMEQRLRVCMDSIDDGFGEA